MTNEIEMFTANFAQNQMPNLLELENYAHANFVPICSKPLASFLNYYIKVHKPTKVLEIGTAIGYSAIIMSSACKNTIIDTIELDTDRLEIAKQNIKNYGVSKQINTICGDAGDVILNLEKQYDLIFLDGPKTQYFAYLDSLLPLLSAKGTLIADNIFQRGMTTGEKELNPKYKATIEKMQQFVNAISNNKLLTSTILPIGDGVLLATKLN